MFCAHCGKELEPGATFCGNCGKKNEIHVSPKKVYEFEKPADEYASSVQLHDDLSVNGKETADTVKSTTVLQREVTPVPNQKIRSNTDFNSVPRTKAYPNIQKEQVSDFSIKFILWFFLFVLCSAISAIFIFAVQYDECIKITSAFDGDVCKYLSFSEVLQYMYSGCTSFSPTVASVILAVSVYMLLYSLPVVSLIMFIGVVMGNSKIIWHTASSILNFLSAVMLMLIMPLALRFVPDIINVLAEEVSIIAVDVGAVSYIPLIAFGAIIMLLIGLSYVLLFFLLRRLKDEKESA